METIDCIMVTLEKFIHVIYWVVFMVERETHTFLLILIWFLLYCNYTSAKETKKGFLLALKIVSLKKFQRNYRTVLDYLPEEKLATQPTGIKFDDKATSRALDVHWNLETDSFVYEVNEINQNLVQRDLSSKR